MIGWAIYFASVAVWAFAGAAMWNWFIAPLGVPEIGPLTAIGVSATAWFFVGVAYGFEPRAPDRPARFLATAAVTFGFACIIHLLQVWAR